VIEERREDVRRKWGDTGGGGEEGGAGEEGMPGKSL